MKEIEKELEKKSRKKQEEEPGVLEFLQKMLPLDATTISREAVLRNVPVYALEEGASLDDILGRVDNERLNKWMDNPLFRYKKEGLEEINVQPEKAINMLYYPEIHGDVPKEQLLKFAVSELRKLPRKVDLDDLLKDGKPMPTLYEIEQQRKEAAKD